MKTEIKCIRVIHYHKTIIVSVRCQVKSLNKSKLIGILQFKQRLLHQENKLNHLRCKSANFRNRKSSKAEIPFTKMIALIEALSSLLSKLLQTLSVNNLLRRTSMPIRISSRVERGELMEHLNRIRKSMMQ